MGFSAEEKQQLLAIKGIGPKIIERLEQIGFSSLQDLSDAQAFEVSQKMATIVGSLCWHNNPSNLGAINAAIKLSKKITEPT